MPTGSCLCTANKYDISEEAVAAARKITCHCARCRKISGGYTTTNLVLPQSSFSMTSGAGLRKLSSLLPIPSNLSTFDAVMQGDKHGHICFCRHCGSVLYRESQEEGLRGLVFVPVGTLDNVDLVKDLREEEWY